MSSEVAVDTATRDAVQAFLVATEVGSASSSSEEETVLPAFRPAGLGLGATFVSHALGAGSTAERRLAGALRKERETRHTEEAEGDEESTDEEGVSKAKSMGKRKRGGQDSGVSTMLKKGKNAEKFEEKKPVRKQVAHHQAEGDNQTLTDSANGRKGFERMGATDAQNEARSERKNPAQKTWISSQVPRKKRKRRSRQKNLRRDKRPPHEKPSYLTEETLRGSRLQPQQMSVENGQRDVEQV